MIANVKLRGGLISLRSLVGPGPPASLTRDHWLGDRFDVNPDPPTATQPTFFLRAGRALFLWSALLATVFCCFARGPLHFVFGSRVCYTSSIVCGVQLDPLLFRGVSIDEMMSTGTLPLWCCYSLCGAILRLTLRRGWPVTSLEAHGCDVRMAL